MVVGGNAFELVQDEINVLYAQLASTSPAPSQEESQQLLAEIVALVDIQEAIIADSITVENDFSQAVDLADGALGDQTNALSVMKAQLQASQEMLQEAQAASLNQIRMIEINDYYGTVYFEYAHIMQIVVILCVHLCVLMMLFKFGLLPKMIFIICMSASIAIGLLFILKNWYYAINKDPMNAEAYYFTPPPNPPAPSTS